MPIPIFFAILAAAVVIALRMPKYRIAAGAVAGFCVALLITLLLVSGARGPADTELIPAEALQLSDLTIGTDPRFVRISGRVTNGAPADTLREFSLQATLHDCPQADSAWADCATIAQSKAVARVAVPPGQTRDFTAVLQFTDKPDTNGVAVWEYRVIGTRASVTVAP